uniref:AB hydrolase-1 domain-containing protein n=1 Tax=Leptobrachium leishanense TaxID=445787 RepID=A0A8C5PS66_9ANUR
MSAVLKELQFAVPWGHLAAKAWGSAKGYPFLCLHGWQDNANTFDRLIPLLPQDNYYVSLDFSGHGLSSHLPQGMRYQHLDYLTDVHRAITALGWKKFSIVAHSMGGVIAGMFASIFPESVRHLFLLDSYGFLPPHPDFIQSKIVRATVHFRELEGATKAKVHTIEGAVQRLLSVNSALTADSAKLILERGTTSVPGGVTFNRDIRVSVDIAFLLDISSCLHIMKNITADVHIILATKGLTADLIRGIYTEHGQSLLTGYQDYLKERFQLSVVDGNHFVHLNEPEKVAELVCKRLLNTNTFAKL